MTPGRFQQIEELFARVIDLPEAERDPWLEANVPDRDLRAEVAALLKTARDEGHGLTSAYHAVAGAAAEAARTGPDPVIGRRFGLYRITELLGQGGMGAVYLAMRDDAEFQKRVAIKILRRGMETPEAIERFRQERKILARLEHPNVARLLDGGATEDGLPYIVMEYIEGTPLLSWCEQRRASLTARVRLFRDVCAAVQYAHQNLIVHRDLKSGNILVTADGVPKLLDFGIAKLLDNPYGGEETVTAMRAFTPHFASPEQILGAPVTTSSDVYSLGVVLFQLFTGKLPHEMFPGSGAFALERAICETPAPRPSSVVEDPKRARQLRGDLDYVCLKALRKEPPARYSSPEQLSADLLNYLEGRPVAARGGAFAYRASRFVRRHKYGIAASLVLAASVAGGVASTVYQQRRAERRFQQVRNLANTFLFKVHDGLVEIPGSTAVRETLVQTALQYLDSLAPDAPGDRSLQLELASAYERVGDIQNSSSSANLGQTREALRSWKKALDLLNDFTRRSPNDAKPALMTGGVLIDMGFAEQRLGNFATAQKEIEDGLAIGRHIDSVVPSPDSAGLLNSALNRLGDLSVRTGSPAKALDYYRQAKQGMEASLARWPDEQKFLPLSLAFSFLRIGDALHAAGDPAGALASYREGDAAAIPLVQRPGVEDTAKELRVLALSNIGDAQGGKPPSLGKIAEAQESYREAIRQASALSTADPKNARILEDLADAYRRAIPTADSAQASDYGRALTPLAARLLERSPDSLDYLVLRAAALWGVARGAGGPVAVARFREAEGAQKTLAERFPDDSDVRLQWLRIRLDLAAATLTNGNARGAAQLYHAIVRDAGDPESASLFIRAVAEEAQKELRRIGL